LACPCLGHVLVRLVLDHLGSLVLHLVLVRLVLVPVHPGLDHLGSLVLHLAQVRLGLHLDQGNRGRCLDVEVLVGSCLVDRKVAGSAFVLEQKVGSMATVHRGGPDRLDRLDLALMVGVDQGS
jgi:hypothetical protein